MGVRLYDPNLGRFLQTAPEPGGSDNAYDYAHQDPYNTFDLDGDRFHFKRPKWVNWKNAARVGGFAGFGACVFLSAGVCTGVGLVTAVVSARASAGRFTGSGFRKAALTNGVTNTLWAGIGWGLSGTRLGNLGVRYSRHGARTWSDRVSGFSAHARRRPWGGHAAQAVVGAYYCGRTRSCPR
ncbi:hypothetical protein [Frankia gtarii]|nr:hypothetical protein [Frankia gtarii]